MSPAPLISESPSCFRHLITCHVRFGEVDYGELEEFSQLTVTVDGKDLIFLLPFGSSRALGLICSQKGSRP